MNVFLQFRPEPYAAVRLLAASAIAALMSGPAGAEPHRFAALDQSPPTAVSSAQPRSETAAPGVSAGTVNDDSLFRFRATGLDAEAFAAVAFAYRHNAGAPLWSRESIAAFRRAVAEDYGYVATVGDAAAVFDTVTTRRFDGVASDTSDADIALSLAFAQLAAGLSQPLALSRPSGPGISSRLADIASALLVAARGKAAVALAGLEPPHERYRTLKDAWRRYGAFADAGGWSPITGGPLVRPDDRDTRLPALRARLAAEAYLAADSAYAGDETLNGSLVAALQRFQRHHGLADDGVLGPNTLSALNESVDAKRQRIAVALAQWRAAPPLGERYVMINIPSFTVSGWSRGRREIAMRAIVGQPSRPTPLFSDTIEYVVTHPTWNVPVSIVQRDKLPILRADPDYTDRAGFRVYDRTTGFQTDARAIDWYAPGAARRYNLIQDPGPRNALGDLKIIFPNTHAVYMHGTPGQHLFARIQRAFSSGCVRLEHPERLAAWLAQPDDTRLNAALAADFAVADTPALPNDAEPVTNDAGAAATNRWYRLSRGVPVHIVYITVGEADDGATQFWRDVYDSNAPVDRIDIATALQPARAGYAAADDR